MALGITKVSFSGDKPLAVQPLGAEGVFDVAWDSSYPNTGGTVGEPFLSLMATWYSAITFVQHIEGAAAANGIAGMRPLAYDGSANLLAFVEDGTSGIVAQVANGVDLSAVTAQRIRVVGTKLATYSAPTNQNAGVA